MSLGPIARAAAEFERNAPRACVIGLRIFVVALLVAVGGAVVAATLSVDDGYFVVLVAGVGGFVGIAAYFKGMLFDRQKRAP